MPSLSLRAFDLFGSADYAPAVADGEAVWFVFRYRQLNVGHQSVYTSLSRLDHSVIR